MLSGGQGGVGWGYITVPDSSVAFAVPKDTVLNNTADPARAMYEITDVAPANKKALYTQYGPHQVSRFLYISQLHVCHACTSYCLFFGLGLL